MSALKNKPKVRSGSCPVSLRLKPTVQSALVEAETETGLNKSALAQLAIERGLPLLLAQLRTPIHSA